MRLAAKLTLDGMVRALRWKGHDLAERLATGYAPKTARAGAAARVKRRRWALAKEKDDGRGGA